MEIENDDGVVSAIVDFGPPAAPQNLDISNPGQNGQHPVLVWDANSEPDLDHYAIYRGYQDDSSSPVNWNSNPSGTTANTTWTDPFVTINTFAPSSVHYRITAIDDASNESDYSNSVSTKSYSVPKTSMVLCHFSVVRCHFSPVICHSSLVRCRFSVVRHGFSAVGSHFSLVIP